MLSLPGVISKIRKIATFLIAHYLFLVDMPFQNFALVLLSNGRRTSLDWPQPSLEQSNATSCKQISMRFPGPSADAGQGEVPSSGNWLASRYLASGTYSMR
jgi:hypothetical protein